MRSFKFIPILLTVVLSSLCVTAQTQQPNAPTDKGETSESAAITGRVVNENGQPLQNAVVSLNPVSGGTTQFVATDREGNFTLEGLESKLSYYVNASMPAYTELPRGSRNTPPPTYRVGDSVTLTLTKGGVITGKVTNATGDPLIGIVVRAEMVIRAPNGRRIASGQTRERETDDRGVYRIYGLPAGQYVVMAGGAGMSYSSANVDPYDTDVPTFAPSSSRDTASEIGVRPGEEITGIDITYRGEQGRTISGVVAGMNEGGFNINLTAVGDGVFPWSGKSYPDMNGRSFSFVGLAEGEYDLYATAYSNTREYGLSEVKRIRVRGADVTGIELTPRPLASVAGRVVLDETAVPECTEKARPLFEEMSVSGWHNDTETAKEIPRSVWNYGPPVKPDAQGNFLVRNLAPGEYFFSTRLGGKNWYVRSIQFVSAAQKKPVDATRVWTNLKFGDRLSGLTVTLAQGGASFRGQLALGEGEEGARMLVYLAPVERERADNVLNYFGATVTPDGTIAINGIPPGRYWIFAQPLPEDPPAGLTKVRYPNETETRAQIRREGEAAKTEIEFKPCQNVVDFKLPLKTRDQ